MFVSSIADSATSGLSSAENTGQKYQDAYLSTGFRSGVASGIKQVFGAEDVVNEVCVECNRHLTQGNDVFPGPADKGGFIYCANCYARHFKKGDCQACSQPVVGLGRQYVEMSGKFWHKECFTEGKSCQECSQVIFGEGIQALNRFYHPNCFRCFNCQTHLTSTFIDFNNEPCCYPCRDKIALQRPGALKAGSGTESTPKVSSMNNNAAISAHNTALQQFNDRKNVPDLSRRCDKCLEVVTNGGTQLPNGLLYHNHCFTCAECSKQITGRFVSEDRKSYHPECRQVVVAAKGTLTCQKCKKGVSGRFIKAEDLVYHETCFTCVSCSKSLAAEPYGDSGNGPICEPCLKNKMSSVQVSGGPQIYGQRQPGFTVNPMTGERQVGPKDNSALKALGGSMTCPGCKKATFALDQAPGPMNTKWHRNCLACSTCKTKLDSHAKMLDTTPYCWKCL
ncbi:hypothetical protein SmJEL517_g03063 [Synchytrium microbalum]|uniref:LIM zinc-binding domain-containing protein n=1 Tax=Synchytrium microbalum TaxID=1806994 RepID=A0A507C8C5_9FUNG|nr:uncharacterized protein SmJEL517_g03063 [Synchytrium microbalum]TPX34246.1 hypothetical protein SmJEL517_g03063 [Synchytrium microbalum]